MVELPPLPAGAGAVALEAGLIWEHAAKAEERLTPVELSLEGLPTAARLELPPGREGLHRVELPLPAELSSPLRLTVRSANPESREVCVRWKVYGR